jgi:glycosyltransferase involved in cell wall biosynthesis
LGLWKGAVGSRPRFGETAALRILLATDAWEPQVNGVVRTLKLTTAELRDMGHTVELVAPDRFKTVPLPTYPEIRLALNAYEPMQDIFKAFEPEAIHIATSYHTRFPEYVSARLPVPNAAGYAYMRWFHHPSGRVMVATPSMRDELEKKGFKNLSPWTRGVDTKLFKPRAPGEPDLYADLPRPVFLNVGRVAVEKNIEAFLELDLPGSKVVVGDGPSREELSAKYPAVRFTGAKFGEELAAHFACADVFVFPSLTDTFGLVILEAMAAGLPVAAYKAPGPIDIIPGSGAGVCDDDLKTACLEALTIAPEAARSYAERFSWRASAEEFFRNLEPYPEPEKARFWRRLRRLARLRRRPAPPAWTAKPQ